MTHEIPEFQFIRRLCPHLDEAELRQADEAFMAYVEMLVAQCERLAEEDARGRHGESVDHDCSIQVE